MATPLGSFDDLPFGGDGDDDDGDVGGATGARRREATGGSAVAGAKRSRQVAGPSTGDASGGGFHSRLAQRAVRFGDGAEREEAAVADVAKGQSLPHCNSTSYPDDESLRRSYPGDEAGGNKVLQIGAGERRVVPAGHGVETTADVTMRERKKAAAASAEGRQCEARPSRVQRVADFAAWATKVTEAVRAPPSGEPKRKRRGAHGRRDVDGAATGAVQGQGTTASLGEQRRQMERWAAHETQCGKPREW